MFDNDLIYIEKYNFSRVLDCILREFNLSEISSQKDVERLKKILSSNSLSELIDKVSTCSECSKEIVRLYLRKYFLPLFSTDSNNSEFLKILKKVYKRYFLTENCLLVDRKYRNYAILLIKLNIVKKENYVWKFNKEVWSSYLSLE